MFFVFLVDLQVRRGCLVPIGRGEGSWRASGLARAPEGLRPPPRRRDSRRSRFSVRSSIYRSGDLGIHLVPPFFLLLLVVVLVYFLFFFYRVRRDGGRGFPDAVPLGGGRRGRGRGNIECRTVPAWRRGAGGRLPAPPGTWGAAGGAAAAARSRRAGPGSASGPGRRPFSLSEIAQKP